MLGTTRQEYAALRRVSAAHPSGGDQPKAEVRKGDPAPDPKCRLKLGGATIVVSRPPKR